jgi:hypothetical protein
VPTEMLNEDENRVSRPLPPKAFREEEAGLRVAASRHDKRVRQLRINVAAWVLGSTLITALWVVNQWQANGAFDVIALLMSWPYLARSIKGGPR